MGNAGYAGNVIHAVQRGIVLVQLYHTTFILFLRVRVRCVCVCVCVCVCACVCVCVCVCVRAIRALCNLGPALNLMFKIGQNLHTFADARLLPVDTEREAFRTTLLSCAYLRCELTRISIVIATISGYASCRQTRVFVN